MNIFGNNIFGWKLSNIIVVSLAGIIINLIWNEAFRKKKLSYLPVSILLFSPYILAFSHIPYNNLFSLTIPFLSLFFYLRYKKKESEKAFFLSGLFAGLSCYTFQSAIIVSAIVGVYSILEKRKKLYFLAPAILVGLPKALTLLQSSRYSYILNHPEYNGPSLLPFFDLIKNIFTYHIYALTHYVTAPIIPLPITILLSIGAIILSYQIIHTKQYYKTIFIISPIAIALITSLTFYRPNLPLTRIQILFPFICILSSYGLTKITNSNNFLIFIFSFFYILTQLKVFYFDMPKHFHMNKNAISLCALSLNPNGIALNNVTNNHLKFILKHYKHGNSLAKNFNLNEATSSPLISIENKSINYEELIYFDAANKGKIKIEKSKVLKIKAISFATCNLKKDALFNKINRIFKKLAFYR